MNIYFIETLTNELISKFICLFLFLFVICIFRGILHFVGMVWLVWIERLFPFKKTHSSCSQTRQTDLCKGHQEQVGGVQKRQVTHICNERLEVHHISILKTPHVLWWVFFQCRMRKPKCQIHQKSCSTWSIEWLSQIDEWLPVFLMVPSNTCLERYSSSYWIRVDRRNPASAHDFRISRSSWKYLYVELYDYAILS